MKSLIRTIRLKIQSIYASILRRFKSTKNNSSNQSKRKQGSTIQPILHFFFSIVTNALTRNILIGLLFLSIILLFTFLFVRISTIQLSELFRGDIWIERETDQLSTMNTLVFSYEEDTFLITSLHLLTIDFDRNSIKIFTINPLISYNTNSNIQNILGDTSLADGKSHTLVNYIELITGIRLDGYIAIEEKGLIQLATNVGTNNIPSDLHMNVSERTYSSVELRVYGQFLNELLQKQFSTISLLNLFIQDTDFAQIIYSNYSSDQLIQIGRGLWQYQNTIELTVMPDSLIQFKDGNIFYSDLNTIDKFVTSKFAEVDIIAEQSELEVYNATNTNGLASLTRRKLQNRGITVVRFGNFSDQATENQIYVMQGDIEDYRSTINEISNILRGDFVIKDREDYTQNFSGNIILILGKDS